LGAGGASRIDIHLFFLTGRIALDGFVRGRQLFGNCAATVKYKSDFYFMVCIFLTIEIRI
jgi:hypothetical protein